MDISAKLEEELMTTKLHETSAVAELKEARLRVCADYNKQHLAITKFY